MIVRLTLSAMLACIARLTFKVTRLVSCHSRDNFNKMTNIYKPYKSDKKKKEQNRDKVLTKSAEDRSAVKASEHVQGRMLLMVLCDDVGPMTDRIIIVPNRCILPINGLNLSLDFLCREQFKNNKIVKKN